MQIKASNLACTTSPTGGYWNVKHTLVPRVTLLALFCFSLHSGYICQTCLLRLDLKAKCYLGLWRFQGLLVVLLRMVRKCTFKKASYSFTRKSRPRINIWIHLNSPTIAIALEIFSLREKVNMNRRKTIDYTVTRRSRDSHSQLDKGKTRVDDRDRRDREEKKAKKPFWSGNDDYLVSWVVFSGK